MHATQRTHNNTPVALGKLGCDEPFVTIICILHGIVCRFKNYNIGVKHFKIRIKVENIHIGMNAFHVRELIIKYGSLRIEITALKH